LKQSGGGLIEQQGNGLIELGPMVIREEWWANVPYIYI
jgi:hypothetical protein